MLMLQESSPVALPAVGLDGCAMSIPEKTRSHVTGLTGGRVSATNAKARVSWNYPPRDLHPSRSDPIAHPPRNDKSPPARTEGLIRRG
jgi:hypothetical protein